MGLASKLAAFAARLTSDSKVPQAALAANVAGNGPAFSAFQSVGQAISANTYTKVSLQNEEYDTNNNFDSSTNFRFQPTVAGYYHIDGYAQFPTSGRINNILAIYKNGGLYRFLSQIDSNVYAVGGSCQVSLNGSTDYIEMYVFTSAAVTLNTGAGSTLMQGHLARAA